MSVSSAAAELEEVRGSGAFLPPDVPLERTARKAVPGDLPELLRLEADCFEPWRQDSRRVIRSSLANPRHEIWVMAGPDGMLLAAALFLRRTSSGRLRIYSIATDPEFQGQGTGGRLMRLARERAVALACRWIVLEADAAKPELVAWYEGMGFRKATLLADYYAPGRDAWRFTLERIGAPEAGPRVA